MAVFQWTGAIQLGAFITVPVRAKSAVKTEDLSFGMAHVCVAGTPATADTEAVPAVTGNAGYTQDWMCKGCGEKIGRGDTIKVWKGIPVDTDYLASLKAASSKIIVLDGLVPAAQIDPRYYMQSYDVTPEEGGEKAYVLLVKLLERSGRVAVGRAIMQERETIVTLRPRDGILALEVMYWPEDLTRAGRDQAARDAIANVVISDAELKVGDQLVKLLAKDFDPAAYTNAYADRVKAYLTSLEDGTQAPALPATSAPRESIDLLKALEMAVAAAGNTAVPAEQVA